MVVRLAPSELAELGKLEETDQICPSVLYDVALVFVSPPSNLEEAPLEVGAYESLLLQTSPSLEPVIQSSFFIGNVGPRILGSILHGNLPDALNCRRRE